MLVYSQIVVLLVVAFANLCTDLAGRGACSLDVCRKLSRMLANGFVRARSSLGLIYV